MGWFPRKYFIQTPILLFLILVVSCKEDVPVSDPPSEPTSEPYDFPEGKIYFDILPLDLEGVIFFESMGLMGVFPQDHGGFHHVEIGVPEPITPIYAMADGQIDALGKSGDDNWVNIKYSTTISTKLGHVGNFEDFILEQTGTLIDGQPQYVTIDVKKGQVIAYVSSFSALDIGLHDQESVKNFIYPDIFWFETLYASSILEYFKEPLKSELLAKTIRQQEPRGGKVDFDAKGALSGNWFIPGSTNSDDFENHFAIGYDHIHAHRIAIYDGYARWAENNNTYFHSWVKNNGPAPETVDLAYGIVKYEMISRRWLKKIDSVTLVLPSLDGVDDQISTGVFLFEMLEEERMQAEFFPDKLSNEVIGFSGKQRVYVRNP